MSRINNEVERNQKKTSAVTMLALDTACLTYAPVSTLSATLLQAVKENDLAKMR